MYYVTSSFYLCRSKNLPSPAEIQQSELILDEKMDVHKFSPCKYAPNV